MSKIRIQHDGEDIVTMDMATGRVAVKDVSTVDAAARAFWDALQTVWELVAYEQGYAHFKDYLIASKSQLPPSQAELGDLSLNPAPGGDIIIQLPDRRSHEGG